MYLDWEKQAQDYFAIDIETDGLVPSVIWCMCWENIKTGEKGDCNGHEEIKKFFTRTAGSIYVGHNILKFDAPALNRLIGANMPVSRIVDTLVLATLYNPSIEGGHSLGAWANRLGEQKFDFEDWSKWSKEMVVYCRQDVAICSKLLKAITRTLSKIGFSEKSCYIQHNITHILNVQQKNGFYFDGVKAMTLYNRLRQREEELQNEIRAAFPPVRVLVRTGKMFTKDGKPTAIFRKDSERYLVQQNDRQKSYSAFKDVEFNIGSPKQRIERLIEFGWQPDEFTPKGQPKPTEKSLVSFAEQSGISEVALITKWMAINGRANMINTWLENWNEDDSCIHGKLFVADTLRFRHQAPNTANIPAVRIDKSGGILFGEAGYYTYEARDLWCARPGRMLVGTDAAGLELRMLANYLNRPDFTEAVVNGDPHQTNADLAGVTRPQAKTLIYACLYGAQGPKIAKTLGISVKEGSKIRQQFLERLGIKGIMDDTIYEQKTGRVWLVDGSGVVCPSPHAALNYKLQGGGARVMAQAAIFLAGHIRRAGLDSLKVGDIHDEWQYDVAPDDVREHKRLSVQAIREAGEELNLNVPLDGTAKEGLTWAETH